MTYSNIIYSYGVKKFSDRLKDVLKGIIIADMPNRMTGIFYDQGFEIPIVPFATLETRKEDIEKMNDACKILFNHIDFECFSKVHTDVNTFNCKIYEANWTQDNTKLIFTISADRFLRNMVRAIVGTMVNIGLEKITVEELTEIIESKDRGKAGFSVPAHGLFLTKVEYPFLENKE